MPPVARLALAGVCVVAAIGSAGCSAPLKVSGSKLGVFPPRVRKVRLKRSQRDALHAHASRIMVKSSRFEIVPRRRLLERLRKRKRWSERRCERFKCQAKLAPKLFGAGRSVALELSRKRRRCRVAGHLYDLPRRVELVSVFKSGGCKVDELRVALDQVVCKLAAFEPEPPEDKPDKASKKKPKPIVLPKCKRRDRKCWRRRKRLLRERRARKRRARRRRLRRKRKKLERIKPVEVADGGEAKCLAQASYFWADRQFEEFSRHKYGGRPYIAEQRAAERLLALKRLYDGFASSPVPGVQVAALCRQGMLYDVYAARLAQGEIGRWQRKALALGRPALERRAAAFRKHGATYYQRCLDKARELGAEHPFVKHAKARVDALAPKSPQ